MLAVFQHCTGLLSTPSLRLVWVSVEVLYVRVSLYRDLYPPTLILNATGSVLKYPLGRMSPEVLCALLITFIFLAIELSSAYIFQITY